MRGTRARIIRERTHKVMEKLGSTSSATFMKLYRLAKKAWVRRKQ